MKYQQAKVQDVQVVKIHDKFALKMLAPTLEYPWGFPWWIWMTETGPKRWQLLGIGHKWTCNYDLGELNPYSEHTATLFDTEEEALQYRDKWTNHRMRKQAMSQFEDDNSLETAIQEPEILGDLEID